LGDDLPEWPASVRPMTPAVSLEAAQTARDLVG
jgi:hypothetical protein